MKKYFVSHYQVYAPLPGAGKGYGRCLSRLNRNIGSDFEKK